MINKSFYNRNCLNIANRRLAEMQQELEKAKERALRFQKMLKSEKLKQMALEVCLLALMI